MPAAFSLRQKALLVLFFMALALGLAPLPAAAKNHHGHHTHHRHHVRHGAQVDATASYADIVIDAETGRVLHATNADSLRHPASLTKMMTLYLTFQALESGRLGLNQYLAVSRNAAEQSPSKLGLRPGQRIRVEDAILGLVTESANDAAVVLAEGLGGSEAGFGRLMTRQARALGMTHSHFDNPSGLPDPDQITTARDMAMLGHALIYHYPQFYPYFSRDSFTYAGLYHHNHNHLMDRYDGMDGIKTGYIRASGFNLVASAKRGPIRLIGVVFGGRSTMARDNRMAQLLDQAFADAARDVNAVRVARAADTAEGDSADNDDSDSVAYIPLPAKVAAIFPPRESLPAREITGSTAPLPKPSFRPAVPAEQKPLRVVSAVPSVIVPPRPPISPTSPAAAPTAGMMAKSGNWGIQIGAYNDPDVAQQALAGVANALPQWLARAAPQVQPISGGGSITLYRARLMQLDPQSAQAACAAVIRRGQSCLTVGP